MEWAALISWIVTALGGFVLLGLWVQNGGMAASREPDRRIKPPLIFTHFGLAATGLVLWLIYVFNDSDTLAWIAFAILVVVALIGWTMFAIWWQRRPVRRRANRPSRTSPSRLSRCTGCSP